MVYTCPPGYIAGLMAAQDELGAFDKNAIDREPNKASIEKLLKLPSFRQAYESFRRAFSDLTDAESLALFAGNAARFYDITGLGLAETVVT